MRRREVAIKDVLRKSLPERWRRRIFSVELVQKCWVEAVGKELARRSEPEALNQGVLTVRVTDVTWGRMIYQLQHEILPALNHAIGFRLVHRINFTKRSRLRGLVPLPPDAAEPKPEPVTPESILQASAGIEDEALRALVVRSASRYLEAQSQKSK